MTWAALYLICFVVGFVLSLVSFLAGGLHWHLPFGHHAAHGIPHVGGANQGTSAAGKAGAAHAAQGHDISRLNFFTLAAFLTWFGGAGYLLTRYSALWFGLGLLIAIISGLVAASVVFLFLTRVLMSHEENMNQADYDMIGVLGRLSLPIREGGTGEIIYSQAGTRRSCGARSESGSALPRDAEVVVTRFERGIAYVRRWEEIAGDDHFEADPAGQDDARGAGTGRS
jgi:membrane protein implicated in regulation of membrane protease activity